MAEFTKLSMISGSPGYRKNYIDEVSTFFSTTIENNWGTPDGAQLNRWEEHDIFVTGTMKQGFSQHNLISHGKCLGVAYSNSTQMKMYRTNSDLQRTEPIILASPNAAKTGRIFGEVWRIPTKTLFNLDYYNENGTYLKRVKLPCRLSKPGKQDQFNVHPAWVYLGVTGWWNTRMDQLIECDRLIPNNNTLHPYYLFMKKYETEWEQNKKKAA